jgi:predicted nucleic acid-binding protein
MPADRFLDTNILIYALAQDDPRSAVAEALLAEGGLVSVQVLNEFVSVGRKLGLTWDEIGTALGAIRDLVEEPLPLTVETHEAAVALAAAHGLSIYDALIVAAAAGAGAAVLYSEDMQHGRRFGPTLVQNPFAA